jgi:hypothetical protein
MSARWLARLVDRDTGQVTEEIEIGHFTEGQLNDWYFRLLRTGQLATHRLEYPNPLKDES